MDTTHDVYSPLHEVERTGLRGKLDTLRSRGLSKVHDVQRVIDDRRTAMKSSARIATRAVRDNARSRATKVQHSMQTSPMKWAGIAAGTGFALGLIGRIADARRKHHRATPEVVIIETGC